MGRTTMASSFGLLGLVFLQLVLSVQASPAHFSHLHKRSNETIVYSGINGTGLSAFYSWNSTEPLISPHDDGTDLVSIKDPSIVEINGTYHVFATTISLTTGEGLVYMNFTDFNQANSSTFYYLENSGISDGSSGAPQIFFFEPHDLWYLVYQTGSNANYSTNSDIGNPEGWTAGTAFYSDSPPAIITKNIAQGYWVDFWTICDSEDCFLFSSDDNGHYYRSQTTLRDYPKGMSDPVIVLESPDIYFTYEASNVYNIGNGKYLLIIESIGSDANRLFRSFTASSLSGEWSPLAASEANPFARSINVEFPDIEAPWSQDISHGEVVRTHVDQTLTISPCGLRYIYQGLPTGTYKGPGSSYLALPFKLALLTQLNSACSTA